MITKKVKQIRENSKSYQGKNGLTYVHIITLEEAVDVEGTPVLEFEYNSLSEKCEKFTAGQEATFEVGKRVNNQYIHYTIKPVQAPPQARGSSAGGFKKDTPKQQEVITYLSCASTAANFYSQSSADEAKVMAFAEKLYKEAMSKIPK